MKLLEDTPQPRSDEAVAENRGSGIGAMLAALRHAGMSPPAFRDSIASFSVTFPNHTLLDEETVRWLAGIDVSLTNSQQMALALMRRGQELDNTGYRNLGGLDSRVATRELRELVDLALVEVQGTGRWSTYRLIVPSVRKRDDRREAVVSALRSGPKSRQQIEDQLDLPRQVVLYWLRRLQEEGRVRSTADARRDPRQRYRLLDLDG